MKVVAYLRKTNSSVYIRVSDGRKTDFRVPSGLFIEPSLFDANAPGYKETPDVPKKEREEFNKRLKNLITKVTEEYETGCDRYWLVRVIEQFNHPGSTEDILSPKLTMLDRADEYLVDAKSGTEHTGAIRAIFRRLVRYEAWQRKFEGRTNFVLIAEEFGEEELHRFLEYSADEYKYFVQQPDFFAQFDLYRNRIKPVSKNSVCSTGTRLKAFLNWCVKKGYSNNMSFQNIRTNKHVYGTPYFLTIEERNKVLETNLNAWPHAVLARDMFIFQCFIGCRMGDLFTLTRDNIVDGVLEYIPSKNLNNNKTEVVRVPLHEKAKMLLSKYKEYSPRLFPVISRQYYNSYIKFALEVAGINRIVTILNPLTREEEQHPLYEVATSHTARKTFVGNLYNKVKDQELIASLTGHAPNSKIFERYRTIDDDMKRGLVGMLE
jgi:integrase